MSGTFNCVDSLTKEILNHTILTSFKSKSTVIEDVAQYNDNDVFSAFDVCANAKETTERTLLALYCGTAERVLKKHLRHRCPNRVVVVANGEHTCTEHCGLKSVDVCVYRVGTVKDARMHVCVKEIPCEAPAYMHRTHLMTIDRKLFICPISNCVHLCIPGVCKTAKVDEQSFMCCSLTGNVHSQSVSILSHGWIEDAWRTSVCKPVYSESIADDKVRNQCKRKRKSTSISDKEKHTGESEELLLNHLNNQRLEKLTGTHNIQNFETNKVKLKEFATKHIRCMLPGSDLYTNTRNMLHYQSMIRFTSVVERYTRRCNHLQKQVCIHEINRMHRHVNEGNNNMNSSMHLDEERALLISEGYSSCIVEFLLKLLMHTSIKITDFTFRNLVCALLYLLRTNLCIENTDIFTPDVFLSVLPSPANLHLFGYDKSSFTTTKNQIQCSIIDSVEKGTNPYELAFPVLPYHDTFL